MRGRHHSVRHWAHRPHCILVYCHQMFLLAQVNGRLTACQDILLKLSISWVRKGLTSTSTFFYTQHQMFIATDFPCKKYLSVTRLVPICLSHLTTLSSFLTRYVSNSGIRSSFLFKSMVTQVGPGKQELLLVIGTLWMEPQSHTRDQFILLAWLQEPLALLCNLNKICQLCKISLHVSYCPVTEMTHLQDNIMIF